MIQNKHYSHLLRRHFVSIFGHNLQTIGLYQHSTYQTTWLLRETLLFNFRAAYKLRLASYISKHTSQSLSRPTFTLNFQTIRRIVVFYTPNDFSTVVNIPFQLQNSVLAPTGKLRLQTCIAIAFLYNITCLSKSTVALSMQESVRLKMAACT